MEEMLTETTLILERTDLELKAILQADVALFKAVKQAKPSEDTKAIN